MDTFSIVIPVFNEAKNLKILVPEIFKKLKKKKFELIIVDDNSNDETSKILEKFKKKNFRHLIRKSKRDLSKSCILGFKKARYKNILVMDGDLQHKPSDIKNGSGELLDLHWISLKEALKLDLPIITYEIVKCIEERLQYPDTRRYTRPVPFYRFEHGKFVISKLRAS